MDNESCVSAWMDARQELSVGWHLIASDNILYICNNSPSQGYGFHTSSADKWEVQLQLHPSMAQKQIKTQPTSINYTITL